MDSLHAKKGCIYIIGCLTRPGAVPFAVDLEHKHYPPDSSLNDAYGLFRIDYAGGPYYILELPHKDYDLIDSMLYEYKLKLVNGKPFNAEAGEFRLACDSTACFTLESTDHSECLNSYLFKNDDIDKSNESENN